MSHLASIHLRKRRVIPFHVHRRLRILRPAAVHYPVLRTLLSNIYHARRSNNGIRDIECGLSEGLISSLKNILKVQELSELLDDKDSVTTEAESLSTSESHLDVEFAAIVEAFTERRPRIYML